MAKSVAVLGGGVAGLSAAHELIERGFDVTVYERHQTFGGKARSSYKPNGSPPGLPAEHGFRFFPGFYRHLPDTMRRIPCLKQNSVVFDNLVGAPRIEMARARMSAILAPARWPQSMADFELAAWALMQLGATVPPWETAYFIYRLLVMATSCDARRVAEYEDLSWWNFVGAAARSANYQSIFAIGLSRCLVACRAEEISARTGGAILLQLLFDLTHPGMKVDRLLNGPTSEVWLGPWVNYLEQRGVRFATHQTVTRINCAQANGNPPRVTSVSLVGNDRWLRKSGKSSEITADYYVAAFPVEHMQRLITGDLRRADPQLAKLEQLKISWMNGIQFYLSTDVPIIPGHTLYIDSPWALTSVSQQQFWPENISTAYGRGRVAGIISVDVSNWDTPGTLYNKPARQCTREEIKDEVWNELKLHLNLGGRTVLRDASMVDYQLDKDICEHTGRGGDHTARCINKEPLLINTCGSLQYRPEAVTAISNLFLAADYVRTHTDLATMEGANEAARRAVNGILRAADCGEQECRLWPLEEWPLLRPLRVLDQARFSRGQRNLFDLRPYGAVDGAIAGLSHSALRMMPQSALLQPVAGLLQTLEKHFASAPATLPDLGRRPPPGGPRQKVAILGGGMGSLATAFALTATPELREQYDVTIYQMGWRLGGKGASGRNLERGARIEEHGLHLWFGIYDNAFRMMRACYEELGRPSTAPLATIADAFKPCDCLVLYEQHNDRWIPWNFNLPPNPMKPGVGSVKEATFWNVADEILSWAWKVWESLVKDARLFVGAPAANPEPELVSLLAGLAGEVKLVDEGLHNFGKAWILNLARQLSSGLRSGTPAQPEARHETTLVRVLGEFKSWLWNDCVAHQLDHDDLRLFFTTFDLASTALKGIVEDGLIQNGFGRVNGETITAWLKRHGAHDLTLTESPLLRLVHDMAFAYKAGYVAQPDFAAGAALATTIKVLFTYKGSFAYKMQAGMGDTVFTPFYEVLKRRGVNFKFFHRVTRLCAAQDKSSIERIELVDQLGGRAEVEYNPLVEIKGLPCWPSEPLWEQLPNGHRLQTAGVNFEEDLHPPGSTSATLHGGKDYDLVILGIPPGVLAEICAELDDPKFVQMHRNVPTNMTQAFQLWLARPAVPDLGSPIPQNSIMTTYVEPMDTYCDMTHLIEREDWPRSAKVASIIYFCGVIEDQDGDTQARVTQRVKNNALAYLRRDVAQVLPKAADHSGQCLDWNLLAATAGVGGEAAFDTQFWRGNFQPSERYVLSTAGSIRYRLKSNSLKYRNLFLTGDWLDNGGLSVGCIEAAVRAGLLAAAAITGEAEPLAGGENQWLVDTRGQDAAAGPESGNRARRFQGSLS